MIAGDDQISRFLARLPADAFTGGDPNAPEAVFQSALELDREQEEEMMVFISNWFENVKSNMGYDQVANIEGGAWFAEGGEQAFTTAKTFMGKRQLYEMVYNNEVEWRRTLLGGIYEDHNLVIPAARRVVQQQIARANNFFFGSDPWVTVYPVGTDDKDFANNIDRWVKDRFERAGNKAAHEMANQGAFIRGEAVLKTAHRKLVDFHETIASLLIDPSSGEPMIANDGDYIFEDDIWIENEKGEMVLKRDQATLQPEGLITPEGELNEALFQVRKVTRALTKKDSSETKEIYWRDFLVNLEEPSIEEAQACVHLYDERAIDVATMLIARAENAPKEQLARITEILNNLASGSAEHKAQSKMPRAEEGEDEHGGGQGDTQPGDPIVHLGEFWIHYDPFADGRGPRSLVVLVDIDNMTPIYYDYVANVTPDGYRPFHVVRINPVNNRWHGTGNMETYWPLQEMIDLLANRWNLSQSSSARVDFWNPSAVYEGDEDPNLKLNGGQTYTLKPGFKPEDALQTVILTDIKSDRIHEQIQYLQQHMMNMSGVANANDSRSAGLDTAQLATGINNIHESGMELFNPWLSHLKPGHQSAAEAAVLLEIEHMDEMALFHFFEGSVRRLGKVSRAELRYLDFDIRIEMTRHRTERELVQNEKAYAAFHRFYSLPPQLQALWAPQARRTLTNLEVHDPESLIQEGYFSFLELGIPPDPATDTVGSGLGSQKPGVL